MFKYWKKNPEWLYIVLSLTRVSNIFNYDNTNNKFSFQKLPIEVRILFYYNQAVMNKSLKMSVRQKYTY